jgi:hypothetical protein
LRLQYATGQSAPPSAPTRTQLAVATLERFLQLAPAFFRCGKLRRHRLGFLMKAQRFVGIRRLQELSVQGSFLLVELGDRPFQSLDFLAQLALALPCRACLRRRRAIGPGVV